jgi:hypothetical protein
VIRALRYLHAGLAWALVAAILLQVFFIGLGLFVGFDKRMLEWILLDGLGRGGSVYVVRLTPSRLSLPSARSKRSNIDGRAHNSAFEARSLHSSRSSRWLVDPDKAAA